MTRLNFLIAFVVIIGTIALTALLSRGMTSMPDLSSLQTSQDTETTEQENNDYPIAPNFTLNDLNGTAISLYDYDDKVILLNFWASWCGPCLYEYPQFIKLADSMPDDLVILAVSVDNNPDNIKKFLKRFEKQGQPDNIVIVWDQNKTVSTDLYQSLRLPETLIIAPDKTIRAKIAGGDFDWNEKGMKDTLTSLIPDR